MIPVNFLLSGKGRKTCLPLSAVPFLSLLLLPPGLSAIHAQVIPSGPRIERSTRAVSIVDGTGRLSLRVDLAEGCRLDRIAVAGVDLLGSGGAAYTMVEGGGSQFTSRGSGECRTVANDTLVQITGIRFGSHFVRVEESWQLAPEREGIRWRIERRYEKESLVESSGFPRFEFSSRPFWTGALLGTGGVAWFKLFDSSWATLGVHTGKATFWSSEARTVLGIQARPPAGMNVASAFTRLPGGGIAMSVMVSDQRVECRYDAGTNRRRYLPSRDDIWGPVAVKPSVVVSEIFLSAPDFEQVFPADTLPPFDARSIQVLANTVARLGVIDDRIFGSNSWRTPYGPAVLHEPHIAQMASLIQDQDYIEGYRAALDFYRERAVRRDGRVIPRWAYTCEDAMPGTCDSLGFYEAQWGYLMDSNPDYVINVSELFDFCGDTLWLRGQKEVCERALEYLLRRDENHNGLVEMATHDHREGRGSDWLDIIWASHENAFVNAKLFCALTLWAENEEILGDGAAGERYRTAALRLKAQYNKPVAVGGFWDDGNRWYVHWRDRDGSLHGNNLVAYLNFMAIAYGLCDNVERREGILHRIEREMQKEGLFFWPVCLFSYAEGEGLSWQWPFPKYENGDIFLGLGEVAVRAYAGSDARIPLKYIGNLLAQYERDGLAYQRYNRLTQRGEGDDILANNSLALVGLYRDIYGLKPKHDRLLVEPRPIREIWGTRLNYTLRGKRYLLSIDSARVSVSLGGFKISSPAAFGVRVEGDTLAFFEGTAPTPSLAVSRPGGSDASISIIDWNSSNAVRVWGLRVSPPGSAVVHSVAGLAPGCACTVLKDGSPLIRAAADEAGRLRFEIRVLDAAGCRLELRDREP